MYINIFLESGPEIISSTIEPSTQNTKNTEKEPEQLDFRNVLRKQGWYL